MSIAASLRRPTPRRLLPALVLLAVGSGVAAAPAPAATWRLERVAASEHVVRLHDIAFDGEGHALLIWSGVRPGRVPAPFGGLAWRDAAGGWQRSPDLVGVDPADARVHLHGDSRALLVAREVRTAPLRRLGVAEGHFDGGFGPFRTLDDFVLEHVSAVNSAGEAIVAWSGERSPFVRVAERSRGRSFARPRDLATGTAAAVAINARGDRVLVWRAGRRVVARVKRARGGWSRARRVARVLADDHLRLRALVARNGRVVVTWGSAGRRCGVSVRSTGGRWSSRTLDRRCGPTGATAAQAPVLPLVDSRGATYAVWTGRARSGRRAVKLTRIGSGASRRALVLSGQRGAVLDDVAAGPGRALAITYAAPRPTRANPFRVATYAALRRRRGGFGRASRITPAHFVATRGSRIAFHPLTGEPVVAVPFLIGLDVAIAAAVGPPLASR